MSVKVESEDDLYRARLASRRKYCDRRVIEERAKLEEKKIRENREALAWGMVVVRIIPERALLGNAAVHGVCDLGPMIIEMAFSKTSA